MDGVVCIVMPLGNGGREGRLHRGLLRCEYLANSAKGNVIWSAIPLLMLLVVVLVPVIFVFFLLDLYCQRLEVLLGYIVSQPSKWMDE